MSSSSSAVAAQRLEASGVSPSSELFLSAQKRTLLRCRLLCLLLCLILIAVVLVFYSPVTHNGFLNYDDDQYITNNPHVRAGLTWQTVKWAFTTYDQANWHPLTWLSHALDSQLFGLNPAGHHSVSVLLHAANAVLLFALHAYVWYARRPELRRYAVVACCFALGLLCKPQVITLPFLLCLLDYWPLCRIGSSAVAGEAAQGANMPKFGSGWLVLEKLPLLLLSAASAVVTMKAQKAGGAVQSLFQYSLLLRLETAVISYVGYLGKAFWPSKLVALYPHPTRLYPAWQAGAAVIVLILVTALVLRARDQKYLAVGWFWFLGSLLPMIGLVQVGAQAMADRYAYIPFVGLFLMVTWLAADWAKAHQLSARWLAIPAISYLLVLGTLTYRQVGYWHDIPSFWLRTLALTQNNYVAHDTLGEFLASQGRTEEAAAHFRAALAIRPDDLPANLNLGTYEHGRGNLPAAIDRYQMVALHAGNVGLRATAYGNLGSAYRQMGESMKAKQCYEMSLQLAPDRPMAMAMIGLGLIAQKDGDLPEAVRQYSRAMAVQPTDVGYLLLARVLQQQGRSDEAKAIFERVARFSPNLAEAQKTAESLLSGK